MNIYFKDSNWSLKEVFVMNIFKLDILYINILAHEIGYISIIIYIYIYGILIIFNLYLF